MPFARRPKGFNTINEQFSFNAEYYCGDTSAHTSTRLDATFGRKEYIHVNLFKFMLQITTDFVYGPSHFFSVLFHYYFVVGGAGCRAIQCLDRRDT